MTRSPRKTDFEQALRRTAYCLLSAAATLQRRDAPIWAVYAGDARNAFRALGDEEHFFCAGMEMNLIPHVLPPVRSAP